jgi:xylulokinase
MSMVAAGLDIGGSSVKGWVASADGTIMAQASSPTPVRESRDGQFHFDPPELWSIVCDTLSRALILARPSYKAIAGVTVTSLRQGFVLIGDGGELGPGYYNRNKAGESQLDFLTDTIGFEEIYSITGHWMAPELTLPKLIHISKTDPTRWRQCRKVLFLHDWIIWKLSGQFASEVSLICGGQMADVSKRTWAYEMLAKLQIRDEMLSPAVEAGTIAGAVMKKAADQIEGLETGTAVVVGGSDSQMVALGMGGISSGVVTVVAGSSTPIQMTTSSPILDPARRPWVSTHLEEEKWVIEGNAGYPGSVSDWWKSVSGSLPSLSRPTTSGSPGLVSLVSFPFWEESHWRNRVPPTIKGFSATTTSDEIAESILESHAFSIRSNLEMLETVSDGKATRVLLGGGASGVLATILPDVLGRSVDVVESQSASALAGITLVGRALGLPTEAIPDIQSIPPHRERNYENDYSAFIEAYMDEFSVHTSRRQ